VGAPTWHSALRHSSAALLCLSSLARSLVVFFAGAINLGTDTSAPYSFSYNTRSLPNGAKVLTAKAYDTLNNLGTSAPVNVTFDNDFTVPTTSITSPGSGSTWK